MRSLLDPEALGALARVGGGLRDVRTLLAVNEVLLCIEDVLKLCWSQNLKSFRRSTCGPPGLG